MLELKIIIETPGLNEALNNLAEALTKAPTPVTRGRGKKVVKEEPVKEEPVKEEPVKEEPVKEEPVKEEPILEEPVKEEPILEEPVKEIYDLSVKLSTQLVAMVEQNPAHITTIQAWAKAHGLELSAIDTATPAQAEEILTKLKG